MAKQKINNYKRQNHETIIQGGMPEVEKQYVIPVDTSVTTLLLKSSQNFVPQYTGDMQIEVNDHMKIKAQRDYLQSKINDLKANEKDLSQQLKQLEVENLAKKLVEQTPKSE